jgi:DNA-binding transcriptional LysR family regulator
VGSPKDSNLTTNKKSDISAYTAIQQGRDFNDLYLFAQIVIHNGYSAASRTLGIPKSTLSRRIAALEERLGSRLVQRSSRTFAVTAAGRLFLQHCIAMIATCRRVDSSRNPRSTISGPPSTIPIGVLPGA